ncbi:transposase [Chelatococcus asaccharovorans]|uniref:transposase n=1 Tax=Chelatococcus asaccharovorans TaxID=28210 RepID=UPI002264C33D|nr:transposase [Chelatococcus asaccharovorans]
MSTRLSLPLLNGERPSWHASRLGAGWAQTVSRLGRGSAHHSARRAAPRGRAPRSSTAEPCARRPKRWVVERSFAWATRFRRLVKNYERCAQTLEDLHLVAFASLVLKASLNVQQAHNSLWS